MISFRWLGVAGIELKYQDQVLLVDPYLTRIPFWRQWIGHVNPDQELVHKIIPYADFVLVTHAHHDHLMDVPPVLNFTGAKCIGSANTSALLAALGIPSNKIFQVEAGDKLIVGYFQIDVLASQHGWIPGFTPGPLRQGLHSPLLARDYRMDSCFSYLVTIDNLRLLINSGDFQGAIPQADILFTNPLYSCSREKSFLQQVKPRLVIPIHWDNFWRPLSLPICPILRPPSWKPFNPFRFVDLRRYQDQVLNILPETKVMIAEVLTIYNLSNMA